jgi:hypothetical protein
MRKDFSNISYKPISKTATKQAAKENWHTAEGIYIKDNYTAADSKELEHVNFGAGVAPFLRGPYSAACMFKILGLFVNMQVLVRLKKVMLFTEEI